MIAPISCKDYDEFPTNGISVSLDIPDRLHQ